MSKLKLEDDFDRDDAKFKRKNDDIVKKTRDKKQNVWKTGQLFKVDWIRFVRKGKHSYNLFKLAGAYVVSAADSDQYVTFEKDTLYVMNTYGPPRTLPEYHLFPFLLGTDVVWFMLPGSEDPMADLRALFKRTFKLM